MGADIMKFANEFTVDIPVDKVWALLTDVEQIAACLPGAQLTGVDGDVYQGKITVKVGPVISEFAGTAQFTEKDDTAYRGVIDAKGRDARSAGNAAALVGAQLTADGDKTVVNVDTNLKISGRLAQFGAGIINEVSGELLAQFVANLETKFAATDLDDAPAPARKPLASAATTSAAGTSAATSAAGTSAATSAAGTSAATSAEATADPPTANTAAVATAPATSAVASAPVAPAPVAAQSRSAFSPASEEPEALDLLEFAGGSIYKRALPLVTGLVVVGAIIVWFVGRRRP
jgi:carbon monoxide dehydrogenase subunit G